MKVRQITETVLQSTRIYVLIQRPEYGGGSIYFDDVLVRENGRFVLPELECLNPENLV